MTARPGRLFAKALLLLLSALGINGFLVAQPLAQTPTRTAAPFTDCQSATLCPQMITVPAGSFVAGSPDGEPGREPTEGPRRVYEVRSFAASVYEVTFDQWDTCVRRGGCEAYAPDDRRWGRGRQPVINVSWTDAQSYVRWLSEFTGRTYRLLTEIEWEYAARAGSNTAFSFGPDISPRMARYDSSQAYGNSQTTRTLGRPASVGSFSPNAFGLYDMHGNVWEWVEDCWVESYTGHPASSAARADALCSQHVLRGGSWFDAPGKLRSAQRIKNFPWMRFSINGIRVARDVE